jgi:hypothetical protein
MIMYCIKFTKFITLSLFDYRVGETNYMYQVGEFYLTLRLFYIFILYGGLGWRSG